jgi:hypothetical protein
VRSAIAAVVTLLVAAVLVWPEHLDSPVAHAAQVAVAPATAAGGLTLLDVIEVAGNVAVFVPVGLTLALAGRRWWVGALGGIVLSVTVETVQTFEPGRVASVADVALNAIGAVLGAVLSLPVERLLARRRARIAGHERTTAGRLRTAQAEDRDR